MTASALCISDDGAAPVATAETAALASVDARQSATAALAALSVAPATAPPPSVRAFIEELAGMLPVRLTVYQREVLEESLARAVDAIVVQFAG